MTLDSTAAPQVSAPLRLGLLLTAAHDASTPPRQQVDEHLELAGMASGYGFDLLMVGQHYLPTDLRYYQPIPYLAWLSALFPQMRVGTGILLMSLGRPVDIAEQIATLDVVSGGRVVLGLGLGYTDREFDALGIPRKERVARFEQGLELVRSLWSGERTEHHGVFGDLVVEQPLILPVQQPHPPIWIAGQAPPTVRRAARLGDAWYPPPFLSHQELIDLSALHTAERDKLGRGPARAVPIRREIYLADTHKQAAEEVAPYAIGRTKTYLEWGLGRDLKNSATMQAETQQKLDERFLLGTPQSVAARLMGLRTELGMTDFVYRVQWPGMSHKQSTAQLRRFGEEVLPLLRP